MDTTTVALSFVLIVVGALLGTWLGRRFKNRRRG